MKPLRDEFLEPGEVVQGIEKGTRWVSLPTPWGEVALYVLKFIACEGRFSFLFAYHFKFLNHLRHQKYINMLYFLWKSLDLMCIMVKNSKNIDTSLAYHGMIRLLVEDALKKINQIWESFMRVSPNTRKTSRKRRSTLENTHETPRKKSVRKESRRILRDETPTNSMKRPRTRSRSRDKKEQQYQEKLFSQNKEIYTIP